MNCKALPSLIFWGLISSTSVYGYNDASSAIDKIDHNLTYQLGSTTHLGARRNPFTVNVGAAAKWNMNASCSGWDMDVSVENILNGLEGEFDKLQRNAVNSMKGMITSFPMLQVQRSDPGLYEMMNSGIVSAEDIFGARVKTCQEMSRAYAQNGGNPVANMIETSGMLSLQEKAESRDSSSIVGAVDEAESEAGSQGVLTIDDEKCGGESQELCDPVSDAIAAAYKSNTNTQEAGSEVDGVVANPWYKEIWKDEQEATDWIKKIVGYVEIGTCETCEKIKSVPGKGIYEEIANETLLTKKKLNELVVKNTVISEEELLQISSKTHFVSNVVIEALRAEEVNRSHFINSIAGDVALMKTVDKLLAARRILALGKEEKNIAQNAVFMDVLNDKISENIISEISIIKTELELKKLAEGDTVGRLLNNYASRASVKQSSRNTSRKIIDGMRKVNGASQ